MKTINSKDEANEAVLEQGKALRIQPPAPNPTEYYYIENGQWVKQLAGQETTTECDVEYVRKKVKRNIPKNDNMGGGGVRAVDMDAVKA